MLVTTGATDDWQIIGYFGIQHCLRFGEAPREKHGPKLTENNHKFW